MDMFMFAWSLIQNVHVVDTVMHLTVINRLLYYFVPEDLYIEQSSERREALENLYEWWLGSQWVSWTYSPPHHMSMLGDFQ